MLGSIRMIEPDLHVRFHSELKKTPKFKPKEHADSNYIHLSWEKRDFAIQTEAFILHTY